jgi:Helix-turn-helix domain
MSRRHVHRALTEDERRRIFAQGFYTPDEAGRELRVTAHHVRNLCHAGQIRYNRIPDKNGAPGLIRIPIVEIEDFKRRTLVPLRDEVVA